jgi:hypothetical protein
MAVLGFQTEQGSIYTIDNAEVGKPKWTRRLKLSGGAGEVKYHEQESLCLFAPPEAVDQLSEYLIRKIRIAHKVADGNFQLLFDIARDSIPAIASEFAVYILDKETEKVLGGGEVFVDPAIGRTPVEKRYWMEGGERQSETHIGNKITKIYEKQSDVIADIFEALRKIQPITNVNLGTLNAKLR